MANQTTFMAGLHGHLPALEKIVRASRKNHVFIVKAQLYLYLNDFRVFLDFSFGYTFVPPALSVIGSVPPFLPAEFVNTHMFGTNLNRFKLLQTWWKTLKFPHGSCLLNSLRTEFSCAFYTIYRSNRGAHVMYIVRHRDALYFLLLKRVSWIDLIKMIYNMRE